MLPEPDGGQITGKIFVANYFVHNTKSLNAKIALKYNILRRFLAGEEGFEPSAYGFGDRRSTS